MIILIMSVSDVSGVCVCKLGYTLKSLTYYIKSE
jgi:hypothetical protein